MNYINGHSHSYTTKTAFTYMYTCIQLHVCAHIPPASYADTDVEKCIARSDNEGWALICAGGEAEIGK